MGWPSLLSDLLRDQTPVGGEIFRTRPYRPWAHTPFYTMSTGFFFTGVKRPGRVVNHPSPYSVEVKVSTSTQCQALRGLL
jgi:hypothetical protein